MLPLLCTAICAGTLSSCKPGESSSTISTPSGGSAGQAGTIDKADLPTGWEAKKEMNTFYQTGSAMDPRTLLQTDFVKLSFIGNGINSDIPGMVKTYTESAVPRAVIGDMALTTDCGECFTSGSYDGEEHKDIVLRKRDGSVWQFGLVPGLPYVLPTKEWNDYLAEIVLRTLDAGALYYQALDASQPL